MMKRSLLLITIAVFLLGGVISASAVENTLHGQFRINYYSLSNSEEAAVDSSTSAARLRWRPTWDAKLADDVNLHTMFNIGHITSNQSNTSASVRLRHAVLDFGMFGGRINAGLVPLSDKFGDTLFSGDWDFNPLSLVWLTKAGGVDVRLGTGKLQEGTENRDDDADIYIVDVDAAVGKKGTIGGSVYRFRNASSANVETQDYIGARYSQDMGVKLNAFFVYNTGKIDSATSRKNKGYAIKAEGIVPAGSANLGVMFLTSTGDKEYGTTNSADSFITPMTSLGHTGYWGYTGKLNIQGPTDTGIDSPLNIDGAEYSGGSGKGRGIMTVQAKADFPIMNKLSGYLAYGYYQHAKVPAGQKKAIGSDIYAEAKYNIAKNLNLQAGVDYAMLKKTNEAYNYTKDNNTTLFFSRLQLEY